MLLTTLIVGLIGAILMFAGDMTLYYDPNDYCNNGSLDPIINIMKKLPKQRVMLGYIVRLGNPLGQNHEHLLGFSYCAYD